VDSSRELMLEDARSILDGLWRMARLAQEAAESLDDKIEDRRRGPERHGRGRGGARGVGEVAALR
jgi:hypothetical protein